MTRIRVRSVVTFGVIFTVLLAVLIVKNRHVSESYMLRSFTTETGWGYEISCNGSVFIHQENIPAIQGNKSFIKAKDARRVGLLVIKKLKSGKLPTITMSELEKLEIEF